jgi:hypothetical protein
METVACNLCGSTRHTALYQMPDRRGFQAGIFTVVECNRCGLGFVNPRPRFQDIGKYYPKEYYEELEEAHFGRDIFVQPSCNWLYYQIKIRLWRRPFTYADIPMARPEFFKRYNLKRGILSALKYTVTRPLPSLDRDLLPVFTWIQVLRKTYGISTYVARRLS